MALLDSADVIASARRTLSGSTPIRLARQLASQPASALGQVATRAGFPATGRALGSGRIDDMVKAIGKDAVGVLTRQLTRRLTLAVDRALGKWGEWLQALDTSDPPPSGDVLLVLGSFMFSVGTVAHQQLSRSWSYRWPVQERIGRAPALQFAGPGEEKISLDGYTLPTYMRQRDPLARLREMAASGDAFILLDHFGKVFGTYAILSIAETHGDLDVLGRAQRIEFKIELAAYGDDAPAAPTILTVPGGSA